MESITIEIGHCKYSCIVTQRDFRVLNNSNNEISHNNKLFWCHTFLDGLDIRIAKDTKEGMKLEKMIIDGKPIDELTDYINQIAIRRVKAKDLINLINQNNLNHFEQGEKSQMLKVHRALGICEY